MADVSKQKESQQVKVKKSACTIIQTVKISMTYLLKPRRRSHGDQGQS